MALYLLLKDVHKNAARAMVVLVAIAATIMCLNEVFQFAALLVAGDASYVAAFGAAGSNALVLLLLDMHHYGFLIAQIFFGLWLVPLGYLAYKSGMFPKALGVVLIVAGVSYLVDMLAAFLVPDVGQANPRFLGHPADDRGDLDARIPARERGEGPRSRHPHRKRRSNKPAFWESSCRNIQAFGRTTWIHERTTRTCMRSKKESHESNGLYNIRLTGCAETQRGRNSDARRQ